MFSTKNIGIFEILMFEILTKTLTKDVVSFEQPSPDLRGGDGKYLLLRSVSNCLTAASLFLNVEFV